MKNAILGTIVALIVVNNGLIYSYVTKLETRIACLEQKTPEFVGPPSPECLK